MGIFLNIQNLLVQLNFQEKRSKSFMIFILHVYLHKLSKGKDNQSLQFQCDFLNNIQHTTVCVNEPSCLIGFKSKFIKQKATISVDLWKLQNSPSAFRTCSQKNVGLPGAPKCNSFRAQLYGFSPPFKVCMLKSRVQVPI